MKIAVSGSRGWTNTATINSTLSRIAGLADGVELWHGTCRGADQLCAAYARDVGWTVREFPPASWTARDLLARNRAMIAAGPDLLVAFVAPDSVGTWHTVTLAMESGLRVVTVGTHVATNEFADRAHLAAGRLVANGGWKSARRRALAVAFAALKPGDPVPPGWPDAVNEALSF